MVSEKFENKLAGEIALGSMLDFGALPGTTVFGHFFRGNPSKEWLLAWCTAPSQRVQVDWSQGLVVGWWACQDLEARKESCSTRWPGFGICFEGHPWWQLPEHTERCARCQQSSRLKRYWSWSFSIEKEVWRTGSLEVGCGAKWFSFVYCIGKWKSWGWFFLFFQQVWAGASSESLER